jgi:hypothetical protein
MEVPVVFIERAGGTKCYPEQAGRFSHYRKEIEASR